jgi:hypothetical protein
MPYIIGKQLKEYTEGFHVREKSGLIEITENENNHGGWVSISVDLMTVWKDGSTFNLGNNYFRFHQCVNFRDEKLS